MKTSLLLIYNPTSGKQVVNRTLGDIVLSLQERWEVDVRPTSHTGHAEEIAASVHAGQYDIIVAAGGDGTIHEVVNGIMMLSERPILGILPAGTANDIARSLQIPLDMSDACEFLKNEPVSKIEVGRCRQRYFINFLGFGLISTVSNQVEQATKAQFGYFTYYVKSLQHVRNQNVFKVKVETSDQIVETDAVMGYVANGRSLAGIELFPDSGLGDGKFDVILVHDVKISELMNVALSYFRHSTLDTDAITRLRATSFTIDCEPLQLLDMDGEKTETTPVHVELIPEALRVVGRLQTALHHPDV